jgi:hypothetical protein
MAGRSPKQKRPFSKENMKDRRNTNTGSDYRLVMVLGGAVIIAIAIIVAVMLTSQ